MDLPIKIISTDFDGTLHTEIEEPPVPQELQSLIGGLQTRGVTWVINTGRDLASLTDALAQSRLSIQPDYVVTVEREIYRRKNSGYIGHRDWNVQCSEAHHELFQRVKGLLPGLIESIKNSFESTIFEDVYSPFCLIARNSADADAIFETLLAFARRIPHLAVVRNDIYFRFAHEAYNKGSALSEIARGLSITSEFVFAAGDHLNDLPMLTRDCARWLVAPDNAIEQVKEAVRSQQGYVSQQPYGYGVARGLEYFLELTSSLSAVFNSPRQRHKST